jgi:hypothetical protein
MAAARLAVLLPGMFAATSSCRGCSPPAHKKALGEDHRWTKDSARVSAEALAALGRTDEAAKLSARFGIKTE